MSALYGRLRRYKQDGHTDGKEVTAEASGLIESKLETWTGSILTTVWPDGSYMVCVGTKAAPTEKVADGKLP